MDYETDPFANDEEVAPFACGFFDGEIYVDFWGDDCVAQFFAYLRENYNPGKLIIYAHNGGKFDFYFQVDYLDPDQEPLWIGSRLVSAKFAGQEFRDSAAIMPVPLKKFTRADGSKKTEIDYAKMKRGVREKHKREILSYQKQDCLVLYDAATRFYDTFGDRLTVGGTALATLQSFHGFEKLGKNDDKLFRQAYFGGRVECFEIGNLRGDFKVYDVNSMYPSVMRNFEHPVSSEYQIKRGRADGASFIRIRAVSDGALPARDEDGSLMFPRSRTPRDFFATVHEIDAGIETGTLTRVEYLWSYVFRVRTKFDAFVDEFYSRRLDAKAKGDAMLIEFWKFILNSSYGKFALNPENFKTWAITKGEKPDDKFHWELDADSSGGVFIWSRPNPGKFGSYKNVACAASITGASRAQLLRGIAGSNAPAYCDTDSLICSGAGNLDIDETRLGAWKLEGGGNRLSIAGKKLYALRDGETVVKVASKGNRLSYDDDEEKAKLERAQYIERIAGGEIIQFKNPIPHFKRDGKQHFIHRTMRQTGKVQSRT